MTDDQTEHVDPIDFDLEAWVAGAVAATDRVEVSSRAGLAAQLIDLMKQHEAADKKPGRAAAKRAEVTALAEQIRETAEALDGSWVEVEFRVPTPTERREAFKGTTDDDAEQRVANLLERVGKLRPELAERPEESPATVIREARPLRRFRSAAAPLGRTTRRAR